MHADEGPTRTRVDAPATDAGRARRTRTCSARSSASNRSGGAKQPRFSGAPLSC
ncbi:hypothetical protein ACFPRL_34505 [Pseudoclavibacter helvolus]